MDRPPDPDKHPDKGKSANPDNGWRQQQGQKKEISETDRPEDTSRKDVSSLRWQTGELEDLFTKLGTHVTDDARHILEGGKKPEITKKLEEIADRAPLSTPEVTQELEREQKSKADVRERTDAIKPQNRRSPEQQQTLDRQLGGKDKFFDDHMKYLRAKL